MASSDNIFNVLLLGIVAYVLYSMGLLKKSGTPSTGATPECPRGQTYNRGLFGDCDPGYTFSLIPGYDQYCECQVNPPTIPPPARRSPEQECRESGGVWDARTRECGYGGVVPTPTPPPPAPGIPPDESGCVGNACCPTGYYLDISTRAGAVCLPYPGQPNIVTATFDGRNYNASDSKGKSFSGTTDEGREYVIRAVRDNWNRFAGHYDVMYFNGVCIEGC